MFNIQKYIELFKINNKFRISIILIAVSLLAILIGVVALFLNRTTVTYTVTFDSAGGTTITEQVVKSGEKVKKPNDPIKEGYIFIEWQYKGSSFNFSTPIKSDIHLNAKWENVNINNIEENNENTNDNNYDSNPNPAQIDNSSEQNIVTNQEISIVPKLAEKETIRVQGGDSFKLELSENPNMDIELYNSTSENGNYNYVKTLPASEYNDIDAYALNGIKQYYKVRLKSGESYSDYSNAVEVENDIKSIRVTRFTKNNLNLLHLTSVGNIELHRADQGDGDYQLLKTMTKEEYWEHDGIVIEEDNQNYFYKVRLYKKYGEITLYSSFTNTISFN